jgi:triosephosphate isomerase (TIM)
VTSVRRRTRLVAGNWKMHGSRASNSALLEALLPEIGRQVGVECALCPPFPYLEQVCGRLQGTPIACGAQNLSEHAQGAYTGEVSAAMLKEFGCRYVIVGHSERRQHYGESDARVAAKFATAQAGGLTPILCVGETLEERESGRTEEVVARQLDAVLSKSDFGEAALAYEPVWAIGTGRNATPEQASEAIGFIRSLVADRDRGASEAARILYGGSVKPANAGQVLGSEEIDGALVGGASLDPGDFAAVARACR